MHQISLSFYVCNYVGITHEFSRCWKKIKEITTFSSLANIKTIKNNNNRQSGMLNISNQNLQTVMYVVCMRVSMFGFRM